MPRAKKPKTRTLRYLGTVPARILVYGGGPDVTVAPGAEFTVSAELADRLLEQPANYEPVEEE